MTYNERECAESQSSIGRVRCPPRITHGYRAGGTRRKRVCRKVQPLQAIANTARDVDPENSNRVLVVHIRIEVAKHEQNGQLASVRLACLENRIDQ